MRVTIAVNTPESSLSDALPSESGGPLPSDEPCAPLRTVSTVQVKEAYSAERRPATYLVSSHRLITWPSTSASSLADRPDCVLPGRWEGGGIAASPDRVALRVICQCHTEW